MPFVNTNGNQDYAMEQALKHGEEVESSIKQLVDIIKDMDEIISTLKKEWINSEKEKEELHGEKISAERDKDILEDKNTDL